MPRRPSYEKFLSENQGALIPLDGTDDLEPKFDSAIDGENPRSVINLVPEWLRIRIFEVPDSLFEMHEDELVKEIGYIDPRSGTLRLNFWEEFDRVQSNKFSHIDINRVCDRVCHNAYFRNTFCGVDLNVVYLLTPPTPYSLKIKECLLLGIDRMREILSISAVRNGVPNEKLADVQLKMFQTLDLRLHGQFRQKIDQRVITANVTPDKIGLAEPMTLDEIDARIRALEEKKARGTLPPATITVDLTPPYKEICVSSLSEETESDEES